MEVEKEVARVCRELTANTKEAPECRFTLSEYMSDVDRIPTRGGLYICHLRKI